MSTTPVLASSREALGAVLSDGGPGPVSLVATMGALHDGHASLIRTARQRSGPEGPVVVSVFVNPMQFAAGEDLERYPRTLEADLEVCAREGADVVFHPDVGEVYPGGEPTVTVDPGPLAGVLEGSARPTHFHGVLTVVAKLFGLVRPDVAVFGEKDYQQLTLVRRMAVDLCLGVEVVGSPTVREPDGLALSSRNRYLAPEDRAAAVSLSRALHAARDAAPHGGQAALRAARSELEGGAAPGVDLAYLELRDPDLGPAPAAGEARLLVAAHVGNTRLLDNVSITLGPDPSRAGTPDGGGTS